ncbi:hypothetical protein AVEN_103059-1 [Araneus ventricosus]|uniref:Uncharacterized protein n=1 Tax=Araneus ventricosus TaxID=182803 RepID=A0A4Y2BAR3_ARAVE|nr:hypothetical protein AVEN_103059-1 [Araneus ventricosus]
MGSRYRRNDRHEREGRLREASCQVGKREGRPAKLNTGSLDGESQENDRGRGKGRLRAFPTQAFGAWGVIIGKTTVEREGSSQRSFNTGFGTGVTGKTTVTRGKDVSGKPIQASGWGVTGKHRHEREGRLRKLTQAWDGSHYRKNDRHEGNVQGSFYQVSGMGSHYREKRPSREGKTSLREASSTQASGWGVIIGNDCHERGKDCPREAS